MEGMPGEISLMEGHDSTWTVIKIKEMTESLEMLRVLVNLVGTWGAEFDKRWGQSEKLVARLRGSALERITAEQVYWAVYLPMIEYSWGVIGFLEKEGDQITAPFF